MRNLQFLGALRFRMERKLYPDLTSAMKLCCSRAKLRSEILWHYCRTAASCASWMQSLREKLKCLSYDICFIAVLSGAANKPQQFRILPARIRWSDFVRRPWQDLHFGGLVGLLLDSRNGYGQALLFHRLFSRVPIRSLPPMLLQLGNYQRRLRNSSKKRSQPDQLCRFQPGRRKTPRTLKSLGARTLMLQRQRAPLARKSKQADGLLRTRSLQLLRYKAYNVYRSDLGGY